MFYLQTIICEYFDWIRCKHYLMHIKYKHGKISFDGYETYINGHFYFYHHPVP